MTNSKNRLQGTLGPTAAPDLGIGEQEEAGELLFSYGTLQLETVQLATFGRVLTGSPDVLSGFEEVSLFIEDPTVVHLSGKTHHKLARFTGKVSDTLSGTAYALTATEIQNADNYEVEPYERVLVVLHSGRRAWVYVDGMSFPKDFGG